MWLIVGIAAMLAWVGIIEFPALRKQKKTAQQWILAVLTLGIGTLGTMIILELPLPNPIQWLMTVFAPVTMK